MNWPLTISTMQASDGARWDKFVQACDQATFFHLSGWANVVTKAYGHRCHYLYAEHNGEIVGVLPLVEIRSWLFGHSLVSTPFCVYGGVAATEPAAKQQLIQAAQAKARDLGVSHLELRHRAPECGSWPTKQLHVTFIKELPEGRDAILASIKKKQRAVIRQALKGDLRVRFDSEVDDFFQVYSESVRNLGTPVFPKRYFKLLKQEFDRSCDILTVRRGEQAVSSVMNFYFRDQVLPYYGGGVAEARALKSSDLMYYELMCNARERGYRIFDFGRSKIDSGAYHYKRHWGIEPAPLYYQFDLLKSDSLPDLNPNNPKYQAMIKLWRRLPLSVSQLLGPVLARSLG